MSDETFDPNEPPLGWDPDQEAQHDEFVSGITLGGLPTAAPEDVPKDLDTTWLQDSQGPFLLCHAHMSTGCGELVTGLATGEYPQYSRFATAINDIRMDGGDASQPIGASIGGSLKTGVVQGYAKEALMPYMENMSQWRSSVPEDVKLDALQHRLESVGPRICDYKSMITAMMSGRVAIGFGLYWTTGWDAVQNVNVLTQMPGGRIRGGHAILAFGWKWVNGDRWPTAHNSHPKWGIKRRCSIAPRVWDQILNPRSAPFGAFPITNIKLTDQNPQPLDWGSWLSKQQFTSGGQVKWW